MLFKRMICLCLACMFCLGACALSEEAAAPSFVMAGLDTNTSRSWSDNAFFKRMEEIKNVSFTFQEYGTNQEWKAAKAAMTADGELPDVLFKANLSQAEMLEMAQNGVLMDLTPYLEECCPNLWAILQENPEYLQAITLPDGKIVALPQIQEFSVQNYMWINEKWLKNLNLSIPTTAQELVDVLNAFKTRDPNRNGKQDEIPLGFMGPFDLKFLGHAFGLIANDYNVFAKDGQVHFMPLEENYRLFVTWLRDLQLSGLLDKNGFNMVDTMRQVTDENATPTYGVIITNTAANIFQVDWAADYNILLPLSYDGVQAYRSLSGNVIRGTFAITTACEDPKTVLNWVDYLYSEEGAILATIGQQNVDFVVDGDQTWRYLDQVQGNSYFTVLNLIDGLPYHPGVQASEFQSRMSGLSEAQLAPFAQQLALKPLLVEPFPAYLLTREEEAEIARLQNQIGYYVDVQLARWVLGEEEISDETFAAFEETLNELGIKDFLAFWQDVLDRT